MAARELGVVLGVAVVLVLLAAALVLISRRRGAAGAQLRQDVAPSGSSDGDAGTAGAGGVRRFAAVVVNPTKVDVGRLRTMALRACAQSGYDEPLWLQTTARDIGETQARRAVEAGAEVVLVCGGDGTVRAVAQAMAGSGRHLALLPAGTGNLLARNLNLPIDDLNASLKTALTGTARAIDVGRVWIDRGPDGDVDGSTAAGGAGSRGHVFTVMAGIGFDAAIMVDAPEGLKKRVGWLAYFVSGMRHLKGRQVKAQLVVDGAGPVSRRVRTIVVGNCGRLTGGLHLLPDAMVDDGLLDAVSIAPEGLAGWAAVTLRVLSRQRKGHRRVEHWRGKRITVTVDGPEPAQVDGDPIGHARQLRLEIDPGALLVRVPV